MTIVIFYHEAGNGDVAAAVSNASATPSSPPILPGGQYE
jgi:hypothetical protein